MKITGLEIEQFGPWNELSLPIAHEGLTVIAGANESGKSALRRFIRGVLFGFPSEEPRGFEPWSRRRPNIGALRVRHRGRLLEIRRAAHDGGQGLVSSRWLAPANAPTTHGSSLIEHCDWELEDEAESESAHDYAATTLPLTDALSEVLGDLPEKLFDQVFSLGLRELHELSNLADDEVARAIHGETLGPFGQTLLGARDEMSDNAARLWDTARQNALPQLLARYEQLSDQIAAQEKRLHRYGELVRLRRHHERRLAELQSRRSQVQESLRGFTHIERVWMPWQRLRNLQAELLRLPRIDDFPEGGIARFDHIEQELQTALKCREALIGEAKQFHRDAKKVAVPRELRRCSAAMRGLLDQREHTGRVEERARAAHATAKSQKEKLEAAVQSLGADWTLAKLEALDTSVAAHYRLVEKARQFRRAVSKRNKWKQRLIHLSQLCQQQSDELDAAAKKLDGISLESALRRARQRRATPNAIPIARALSTISSEDPEIEHLHSRIIELEQRRVSISRQIERLEPRLILPKWVLGVLGFFAVGGIVLALLGLATGFSSNAIAGAAYALLGTVCGGLALSLKLHFEQQVRDSLDAMSDELRENEARLRESRETWQTLTGAESNSSRHTPCADASAHGMCGLQIGSGEQSVGLNSNGLLSHSTPEDEFNVEELERLIELKRDLASNQQKRAPRRDRHDAAAQELTAARQAWCETLTQLGLPESVRVSETFDLWQRLAAANELLKAFQSAEADFKRHLETVQTTRSRIVEILHRLNRRDLEQRTTAEVFQIWDQELQQLTATLQERLRLRREERRRRAEAAEYSEKIEDLRLQRSALLRQGCATDRDDYARRAIIVERHHELLDQIDATKEELSSAGRIHPELAIVEDDLARFDASQHAAQLTNLRREAQEADDEIERLHEELGRARHEIEQLETDDEPCDWLLDREIVRSQITTLAEEWLADEWAGQAIDGIRARYERICQPGILAAASRYFARLTAGKYRTLWTPLRHRSLRVDDATGTTWRLDQLSGSTRELLLLAIRLALIDDFSRRGVDLPLLLDDVLLTLDPARAAVAASELIDFAKSGHQVLFFTCHPHLTSLFTNAGCANLRLSQFSNATERLAG
ncbi:MAG: AAA family ATPase [Planctomycetaceae bacterium]|nr:AAA family ATPase [Planctomycetaceae bacterium]